jgi:hypothetical protein
MTLEEGIIMGLTLNGIGVLLFFFAYYIGFKKYEEKIQAEEDAKEPKPWQK